MQAVKELKEDTYKEEPSKLEDTSNFKQKKPRVSELKNVKEITKFAEFIFNKQKIIPKKNFAAVYESITVLLKKLPDFMKKKSKLSRKMVLKMISGFYNSAYLQILNEGVSDLLVICYEDISAKYGLKKVSDRKLLEFLSTVIKNKDYKRCLVFIKLLGLGSNVSVENYTKSTLLMYIESYHFMINSKIGIITDFEETEDKQLFPIYRAIDCVREKLDGKVEKNWISSVISLIEHKSIPDPRKINTALIELEIVLEAMCNHYEAAQQKIKVWVQKVFFAINFENTTRIPLYTFHTVMRTITKFNKIEELNLKEDLSLDEINEICISLNCFNEIEINSLIKHSNLCENYQELLEKTKVLEKHEKRSYSEEEWKSRLDDCINKWKNTETGVILWQIYENELKRLID